MGQYHADVEEVASTQINSVRKELLDNFNRQVRGLASAFTNKHSLILQNGIYCSVVNYADKITRMMKQGSCDKEHEQL